MSARGLFPLAIGAGIAYWVYNKSDDEEVDGDEDMSPLEELAREAAVEREATRRAEDAKARESTGGEPGSD